MVPNELSVFGPSSKIEPSHKIRQRVMRREFKGGLDPHVNWERKEKRRTARAFEEYGRGRRRQTDDDDCLKETLSDDPERDDAWNQFDPMDYNAGGW